MAITIEKQVFLAFEILERFGFPKDTTFLSDFASLINDHVESPNGAIREKAAQVCAQGMSLLNVTAQIGTILREYLADSSLSQNGLHGWLLVLRYLVCRIAPTFPALLSGMLPSAMRKSTKIC